MASHALDLDGWPSSRLARYDHSLCSSFHYKVDAPVSDMDVFNYLDILTIQERVEDAVSQLSSTPALSISGFFCLLRMSRTMASSTLLHTSLEDSPAIC